MNLISKLNLVSPEIKLNGGGVILPSVGEDETSYVVGVNSDGVANVELTDYVKSGSDPLLNSVGTKLINIYPAWGDINNCSAQASISYDEDSSDSDSLLIKSKGRMCLAADGGAINIDGHLFASDGITTYGSGNSFFHGSAEFTNDVSFKNVPTVGSVNLALISDIPDSYTKTESDEKYALTEELESYVSCTTLATTLNDYAKKDELCGYLPICVYSDTALVESESFSCVALRSYLSVLNGIYIHSGDIFLGETKICGDTGRLMVSYNGSEEDVALTSDIPNIIDNSLVEVFNLGKHVPLEETESKANSITLYGKSTSFNHIKYGLISASDNPATIEFFTDGYTSGSEYPMGTYSQKIAAGPYGQIGIIKGSSSYGDDYVYVDPIATSSDLCSFITKDVTELTCFYTKTESDEKYVQANDTTTEYWIPKTVIGSQKGETYGAKIVADNWNVCFYTNADGHESETNVMSIECGYPYVRFGCAPRTSASPSHDEDLTNKKYVDENFLQAKTITCCSTACTFARVTTPVVFYDDLSISGTLTIPRKDNYTSYTVNFGNVLMYECSGRIATNYNGELDSLAQWSDINTLSNKVFGCLQLKADKATTLSGYSINDAYTKDEVDSNFAKKSEITNVYKYVGSVENYADLPTTDLVEGYVYNIVNECTTEDIACGDNVAWTGSSWDKLGGNVNLSNYIYNNGGYIHIQKTEGSVNGLSVFGIYNGSPGQVGIDNPPGFYFGVGTNYYPDTYLEIPSVNGKLATLADIPDISGKADISTTLSGYGITDAYTKLELDAKIPETLKVDGSSLIYVETVDDEIIYKYSDLAHSKEQNGYIWNLSSIPFIQVMKKISDTRYRYVNATVEIESNEIYITIDSTINVNDLEVYFSNLVYAKGHEAPSV